ncbi:hypothetical protein GUJ93_ZPchr0006g41756 [Zizania palustris]|uniref:Uncharacterized protein n=1 Tax=Zizania palustris TaxID=103762 RepID=A0A8J5T5T1_ZIZPA|nr:hypothetical protein GUJ93_ZPchr0006g41756 [Zizania palustris]
MSSHRTPSCFVSDFAFPWQQATLFFIVHLSGWSSSLSALPRLLPRVLVAFMFLPSLSSMSSSASDLDLVGGKGRRRENHRSSMAGSDPTHLGLAVVIMGVSGCGKS